MEIVKPRFGDSVGIRTSLCTFWTSPTPMRKNKTFFKEKSRHFCIYGINILGRSFYVDVITGW